jgi:hypothetical protein
MKKPNAQQRAIMESDEVKSLVSSYLVAKASFEILDIKVSKVYAELLEKYHVLDDEGKRIYNHEYLYTSNDDETINKIYSEAEKLLRERKIKPDDMKDGYCPALVAQELLSGIAKEIIEITGAPFNVTPHKLLCAGLNKYNEWIELIVGLVMSLPDFKKPDLKSYLGERS